MTKSLNLFARSGTEVRLPAILTLWDVLSWIAFGELRARQDGPGADDFTFRWGHSNAGPTLEALEARAAPEPFCIWCPLALDGHPWDGQTYPHPAWSPDGPRLLRLIARQARARPAPPVPFRRLADDLRAVLEVLKQDDQLVSGAKCALLEILRAGKLTAWGKRDFSRGQPNPAAGFEAIAASVFWDELVTVTEWRTVGADPENPTAIFRYHGPTFRDVLFQADDVIKIWTGLTPEEPRSHYDNADVSGQLVREQARLPAEVPTDRTGAQGRPTSRHLVEAEFQRRMASSETLDSLRSEAKALSEWLGENHPVLAPMTPKTVANCIRVGHKAWKASK